MAKKQETVFAEKVDKDLKATFGPDCFYENIQQLGKIGTPDRLLCIKGRFVALELKVGTGKADRLQVVKLLQIRKAGGLAYVVYPHTWRSILSDLQELTFT